MRKVDGNKCLDVFPEIEDIGVLLDPARRDRLGDDDDPPLDLPPDEDLGHALAEPGGDRLELGVVHQAQVSLLGPGSVWGAQRGVGGQGDPPSTAELCKQGIIQMSPYPFLPISFAWLR